MKPIFFAALMMGLALSTARAATPTPETDTNPATEVEVDLDASPTQNSEAASQRLEDVGLMCFFAGKPPSDVKYTVIKRLKVAKGTYGGVTEILPKFASQAQGHGAHAIIDYTGSQRFGFWPWRMVRPVVRGTAVKWVTPPRPGLRNAGRQHAVHDPGHEHASSVRCQNRVHASFAGRHLPNRKTD